MKRKRLYIDAKTDSHPIRNGWWNGIPRRLGQATVLGHQYSDLWPRFVKNSKYKHGLYFISVNDWHSKKTVNQIVGEVPSGLAQGNYPNPFAKRSKITYPKIWPFQYPFLDVQRNY